MHQWRNQALCELFPSWRRVDESAAEFQILQRKKMVAVKQSCFESFLYIIPVLFLLWSNHSYRAYVMCLSPSCWPLLLQESLGCWGSATPASGWKAVREKLKIRFQITQYFRDTLTCFYKYIKYPVLSINLFCIMDNKSDRFCFVLNWLRNKSDACYKTGLHKWKANIKILYSRVHLGKVIYAFLSIADI